MWDSETAQDLVVTELPGVIGSWILGSFGLYPLGEVVDCYDDIIDLAWSSWQRSNEIYTSHVKGHVGEITVCSMAGACGVWISSDLCQ